MKTVRQLVQQMSQEGAKAVYVGGWVRDSFLGLPSKDLDVEVFGWNYEQLVGFLSQHGKVDLVGKSFGVAKFKVDGQDVDFSLPRRESKNGVGHKGFSTEFDGNLSLEEALSRRDFTVNSMAFDPLSETYVDPFGGREDLTNRVLRATSDKFSEDPLRALRAMQFAGRFDMKVEPKTAEMCRNMLPEYHSLPLDRVREEWFKWALKSVKPSAGLQALLDTGWSVLFPEFHNLMGVLQNPRFHPEGCAGYHSMLVCDEAVELAKRENLNDEDRLVLVFSAMLHDAAKFTHSQGKYPEIKSHGHAEASVPFVKSFFKRLGVVEDNDLVKKVCPLTFYHMAYLNCQTVKAVRKLAEKLEPSNMNMLCLLVEADHSGRSPLPKGLPDKALRMLELSRSENVVFRKMKMLVTGKHLRDDLGLVPTKAFGEMLRQGYEAQMAGEFASLEDGLVWFQRTFNLNVEDKAVV